MAVSKKELRREKIREKVLYKEQREVAQTLGYTILAIIIILLFIGGYAFFNHIYPLGPMKPDIQKPTPEMIAEIENGNDKEIMNGLEYVGNEIGGHKLKKHPISKDKPRIEFYMTNFDKTFTLIVDEGNVSAIEGSTIDPDVRLSGKKDVLLELLDADDIKTTIQRQLRERRLSIEILASESDLAFKGYSTIYEMFGGAAVFDATGAAVAGELVSLYNIRNCFLMFFMCMVLLFVIVLYETKKITKTK